MFQYTSVQLLTNQTTYLIRVHTSPKFWICLHGIGVGTEGLGRGEGWAPTIFSFCINHQRHSIGEGPAQPHSKHNCSLIYLVGKIVFSFRYTCPPPPTPSFPHPPPRIRIWIVMILGISIFLASDDQSSPPPLFFQLASATESCSSLSDQIFTILHLHIWCHQYANLRYTIFSEKKFRWSFSVAFDKNLILNLKKNNPKTNIPRHKFK